MSKRFSLREITVERKKLAKVALGDGEAAAIIALRLKLLANGYQPVATRDKRALRTGWNAIRPDKDEIESWLNSRASMTRFPATGLAIAGGLLTIDGDEKDFEGCNHIEVAHFGAIEGIDKWGDAADVAVIIGRPMAWETTIARDGGGANGAANRGHIRTGRAGCLVPRCHAGAIPMKTGPPNRSEGW